MFTSVNADVGHTEMFGRLAERAATYGYLEIEAAVTSGSWGGGRPSLGGYVTVTGS